MLTLHVDSQIIKKYYDTTNKLLITINLKCVVLTVKFFICIEQ